MTATTHARVSPWTHYEFGKKDHRRRLIAAEELDDIDILSYDSLLEALHYRNEFYVGSRRND